MAGKPLQLDGNIDAKLALKDITGQLDRGGISMPFELDRGNVNLPTQIQLNGLQQSLLYHALKREDGDDGLFRLGTWHVLEAAISEIRQPTARGSSRPVPRPRMQTPREDRHSNSASRPCCY